MRGGLAVFLKTPGLSPLKTRLAAGIGQSAAEAWYRQAAAAVIEVVEGVESLDLHLALAENSDVAQAYWRGRLPGDRPVPLIQQGAGDLGERMARVHESLLQHYGFAILVGADTPQLVPDDLRRACRWLQDASPRLVLGPSRDGGFWLIGSNRPLPLPAWCAPHYSTSTAAADLRAALAGNGEWLDLPTLTDVDELADLVPARTELVRLTAPTPAQRQLMSQMGTNLPESA